jgi:hypothetical protein
MNSSLMERDTTRRLSSSVRRRASLVAFLGSTAIYFTCFCSLAQWKMMWSDEIVTYHLARLPSLSLLWAALSDGPDASGPLHFLTVRLAYLVLGESALATRLPAIVGVWVMGCCLYLAQTQHSCYEGQSSEPKPVKLGRRGGRTPSVWPPKISPFRLARRNHPRFEVVARHLTLDSASFASSFAASAKSRPLSLPLMTRLLG